MHLNRKTIGTFISFFFCVLLSKQGQCLTLSGPFAANALTVSGDVTVSSMTASSMTISNLLNIHGTTRGIKGLVLQTIFSSTTINSTTTSTAPVAIPGMSAAITLSNTNNYVRISLSGILESTFNGSNYTPAAYLSIKRDSTDLGQGALVA